MFQVAAKELPRHSAAKVPTKAAARAVVAGQAVQARAVLPATGLTAQLAPIHAAARAARAAQAAPEAPAVGWVVTAAMEIVAGMLLGKTVNPAMRPVVAVVVAEAQAAAAYHLREARAQMEK
jgi:hypothetical protein